MILRATVLSATLLPFAAATAQTVVSIPCAADATLYESATGSLANGSGTGLFLGLNAQNLARRSVLRFDVAAHLPPGAIVIATSLTLNITQSNAASPTTITGHRLLASFGEGPSSPPGNGGAGTTPQAGDSTWLHRFFPGSTWSTPGGDFDPVPSLTAEMPITGSFSSEPLRAANEVVQSWLDSPATNFGWLLKVDETAPVPARRIESRESTGSPPVLRVTYLLPGQSGVWGVGCPVGTGTFGITWVGAPIGGSTVQVAKTNGTPGALGADFFALALDPVGTPLLPGCDAYLPLNEFVAGSTFVTNAAGGASTAYQLPAGFPGRLIAAQSITLASNPLGFITSDAGLIVLQ
jgi:hypothetical protein